jgi:hypothetical protein
MGKIQEIGRAPVGVASMEDVTAMMQDDDRFELALDQAELAALRQRARQPADLSPWERPIAYYFRWLKRRYPDHVRKWVSRLESPDHGQGEGAAAEALVWNFLDDCGIHVELKDVGASSAPDFLCRAAGGCFYVEVTCISREAATRETGLTDEPGAKSYSLLTGRVREEVSSKASQFRDLPIDLPLVLSVCTLHYKASLYCAQREAVEELLLGTTGIGWTIDLRTGTSDGPTFQVAQFDRSVATRKDSLETVRRHISATVLAGFGLVPPACNVRGVLHPDALCPFDPNLLPHVEFFRLTNWPPEPRGNVTGEWVNSQEAREAAEGQKSAARGRRRARELGWDI